MLFCEQWVKTYGGSGDDRAYSIKPTSDGGYVVVGYTESFGAGECDIWVLKLGSGGDVEWQHAYGGWGCEWASSIQETSDGGYVVAGYTESFGTGFYDLWILKLDTGGNVEWQRTYGGGVSDYGQSIRQTADDGYILSGRSQFFSVGGYDSWIIKLDPEGDVEWHYSYGGMENEYVHFVQQTNDGRYVAAGSTYSFGNGDNDGWVIKLDSAGQIEWQQT